jgi:hypothetical protein
MIPTMLAMLLRFDHYAGPEACDLKTEPIAPFTRSQDAPTNDSAAVVAGSSEYDA